MLATALVTIATTIVAGFVSPLWAARYLSVGVLALINWVALTLIFQGVFGRRLLRVLAGFALKPLLLVLLLLVAKYPGLEITSFLAGFKTTFLVLFTYLIFFGGAAKARNSINSLLTEQERLNG